MTVNGYLTALVEYGLKTGLIQDCDRTYIINQLLMTMGLDSYEEEAAPSMELEDILAGLLSDAVSRGVIEDNITAKDLVATKLMGVHTPQPREVRAQFALVGVVGADRPDEAKRELLVDIVILQPSRPHQRPVPADHLIDTGQILLHDAVALRQ